MRTMKNIKIVYLDMDGVLCDWEPLLHDVTGLTLQELKDLTRPEQLTYVEKLSCAVEKHYSQMLPLRENVRLIRDMILRFNHIVDFRVLTSVGKYNVDSMVRQKKEWLKRYVPEFNIENFRYTIRSKDKAYFASDDALIIDDFDLVRNLFKEKGGKAIDGSNTQAIRDFIKELEAMHASVA